MTRSAEIPDFEPGVPGRMLISTHVAAMLQVGEAQLQSISYTCYLDNSAGYAFRCGRSIRSMLTPWWAYGPPTQDDDERVQGLVIQKIL